MVRAIDLGLGNGPGPRIWEPGILSPALENSSRTPGKLLGEFMHRIAPTDTMVLQKPTQLDENDQHTDAGQAARKPLHERLDFRTSMARTNGRHPQFGPPWGGGGQTKPWLGFSLGGCWSLMAPAPSPGPSSRPQPQGVLEPQRPGPGMKVQSTKYFRSGGST